MDLIKASVKAYEIAQKRGLKENTFETLKHCAGEVLEANEAYNDWTFLETDRNLKEQFADRKESILKKPLKGYLRKTKKGQGAENEKYSDN